MSWRDEYKQAMIHYLLKRGTPVTRGSRQYGYIASDWEEQRAAVNAALADPAFDLDSVEIEESTWSDFDSFDGGATHHGVDARVTIDGVAYRLRYDGSFSELLFGLLEED